MKHWNLDRFPPAKLDWANLVSLIGKANALLARYDGLLHGVVNPEILLSPLTLQEAVLSSRIEGTQASLSEVLQHEAGQRFPEQKELDIQEIINYRRALRETEEQMEKRPLCLSIVKEIHAILLDGVRGHNKARGEFRRIQNWIGAPGSTIEQAIFIPPDPSKILPALDVWEKYIHSEEKDTIVQLALVHAQFEIIHPFLDGNGRIGRILIPLFLAEKKVLSRPMFYLSGYFEAHRDGYYSSLLRITSKGDWQGWVEFFLKAVIEQATENIRKAIEIQNLYEAMKKRIVEVTHSQYALAVLDSIFYLPIFSTAVFVSKSGIPKPTAFHILRKLKDHKIIVEIKPSRGQKSALLCFPDLIGIAEGHRFE